MPKRGENIHKRKDGRWEGRIIEGYRQDGKAKYRSLYGASYYEVKQKQRQAQQDPGRLALPNPGKPVGFREVLFLWLDDSKIKLRPATSDKYLRMINDHLLESLGGYRIDRLNAMTINKFIDEKKAIGRKDKNGGLSSGYIKTLIYIIQAALKYATNNRLCPPLIGDIHKPKQTKSEIQLLTLEEQSRLEQTLLFETDSAKMAVLISLQSGLRIGEVCGLHWDDIDFQNKTLYVRRTISRIKNPSATANQSKTILIEGEPKSENSHRVIPLTQTLLDSLSLYRKEFGGTIRILPGKTTVYLDPRTLQYAFKRILKESIGREIKYHALRHAFATRCIEAGMDIKTLSEILGHANVNITLNTYVHTSIEQKRIQMERLEVYRGQIYGASSVLKQL